MIEKHGLDLVKVAEVGCGVGEIVIELSENYPKSSFHGFEISPQAHQIAIKKNTRVNFHLQDILTNETYFDLLLCIDVFEHVEDYMGFLRELKFKSDFQIFHIPLDMSVQSVIRSSMMELRRKVGHLHYFNLDSALATLQDTGYEVLDFSFTTSFLGLPSKSAKSKIIRFPRLLFYKISPKLMVKFLGGCSLLVLTRSASKM